MKNPSNISKMNDLVLVFYCFLILIISTLGFFFAFLSPTGLFIYFIALLILYLGNKSALKISNGSNIDKIITYSSFILPIIPVLGLFGVGYNYTKYIRLKTTKYLIFSVIGLIFILIIWSIGLSGIDFASLVKDNQTLLKVCGFISGIGSYKFYEKTLELLKNYKINNTSEEYNSNSNKNTTSNIFKEIKSNINLQVAIVLIVLFIIFGLFVWKTSLPLEKEPYIKSLSFNKKENSYSDCTIIYNDKYKNNSDVLKYFYSGILDTCIISGKIEGVYILYDMLKEERIFNGDKEGYDKKLKEYE